jgi:two-component system sensor histidine kinase/response regulator
MNKILLLLILSVLGIVLALLIITYRKLQKHKKLIRIQSDEIAKQLQELIQQNKIQEQINHEKHQLISVVSHDLKGPFNRIFALVQLMNMNGVNEEHKEYLSKIHQISVDGLSMVRNLLDNRKLEDHGFDMRLEEVNLASSIHTLIKHYRSVAEKKNIEVHFESPTQAMVVADRHFVNRVFENLFSNALKFSPYGKNLWVVFTEEEKFWRVMVKDEGPGFNEEDQQKMFGKFQRLSAKPTGGESSTGLGLWIVKTLVEKMEGEIRYESELGKGAGFFVRMKKLNSLASP